MAESFSPMPSFRRSFFAALIGLGLCLSNAPPVSAADVLRIVRAELPPSLGNPFTTVGQPASGIWGALFDTLTQIGETGALEPALARSWEAVEPTRWVFRLRSGVTFHNGAPFNAAAAAAVIRYLQSDEGQRFIVAAEVRGIVSVATPDEFTLELTTATPDPILPRRFAIVFMVEPAAWREKGADQFAQAPIGSGPYRLVDWGRTTGRTRMQAHTGSWRTVMGPTRLEFIHVADGAARLQALASGQADVGEGLSPDDVQQLGRGFRLEQRFVPAVTSITFRTVGLANSPLRDVRVRQALNYAVNREAIVAAFFGARGQTTGQGASPFTFGYNPSIAPYPFDPGKAKALLAEAGFANGFPMKVEVFVGFGPNDAAIYQQVAADWQAIGIDVNLQQTPFANWLRKYLSGEWGDTDAFSLVWDSSAYNDAIRPIVNFSCLKDKPFFCEESIVPLIRESQTEMDTAKREALLQAIMARLHEIAPSLWIATGSATYAMTEKVQTFSARPHGIYYERITLKP
jgi:peptide/nickel transport system substrate-binding protein